MAQIGKRGSKLNLLLKKGSTLGPFFADITPVTELLDLTGAIVRASIRKDFASSTTYLLTCEVTDPNEIGFTMSDEETVLVPYLGPHYEPENQYVWDLELELEDGTVMPIFYGVVKVIAEVTHV